MSPLEDATREVVGVVHPCRVHLAGGELQGTQDACGCAGREMIENVPPNGKYRPVIDLEDFRPRRPRFGLGICDIGAAHLLQRFDAFVHTGDALVKDEGVGEDGASHPAGLGDVDHSEQLGYVHHDVGPVSVHFVQDGGNALYPPFQGVSGIFDGLLRHGHEANKVGKIAD